MFCGVTQCAKLNTSYMYDHSMNDISVQEVAIEYPMPAEDNAVYII